MSKQKTTFDIVEPDGTRSGTIEASGVYEAAQRLRRCVWLVDSAQRVKYRAWASGDVDFATPLGDASADALGTDASICPRCNLSRYADQFEGRDTCRTCRETVEADEREREAARSACKSATTFRAYADALRAFWKVNAGGRAADGSRFRPPVRTRRGALLDRYTLDALLCNTNRPGGAAMDTMEAWKVLERSGDVRRARGGWWSARGVLGTVFADALDHPEREGLSKRTFADEGDPDQSAVYIECSASRDEERRAVFRGFAVAHVNARCAAEFHSWTVFPFVVRSGVEEFPLDIATGGRELAEALDAMARTAVTFAADPDEEDPSDGLEAWTRDQASDFEDMAGRVAADEPWTEGSEACTDQASEFMQATAEVGDVFRVTANGDTFDVPTDDMDAPAGCLSVGLSSEREDTPQWSEFAEEAAQRVPEHFGHVLPAEIERVERVRTARAWMSAPGYMDRTEAESADVETPSRGWSAPDDAQQDAEVRANERAALSAALDALEETNADDRAMFDSINDVREEHGIARKRWR